MELRHIRYFKAVAEEKNFTRAAEKLAIAQPPLSRQIQDLEEDLGTKLFERSPHKVKLTEEGELFLQYASQILDLVNRSEEEVRIRKEGLQGTLYIASVEGCGPHLFAHWISEFQKMHPHVQYILWNGNTDDVNNRVTKSLCEVAMITAPFNTEEFHVLEVYEEPWVAMIPEGHPLYSETNEPINPNELLPLLDDPTGKELEQAIAYQRQLGRGFLKIDTREKLDEVLIKRFSLEECCTETMLLRNKKENMARWKDNPDVIIYDSASGDVLADLLKIDIETFASDYGEDFIRRRDARYVKKAMEIPGFHYYVAYLDGKPAGACYAYAIDGYVVMDALVVREAFRKRYVATTLMKHIASQFKEEMFLHADADDTPKEMYRKMGFETVDELYEYLKMW